MAHRDPAYTFERARRSSTRPELLEGRAFQIAARARCEDVAPRRPVEGGLSEIHLGFGPRRAERDRDGSSTEFRQQRQLRDEFIFAGFREGRRPLIRPGLCPFSFEMFGYIQITRMHRHRIHVLEPTKQWYRFAARPFFRDFRDHRFIVVRDPRERGAAARPNARPRIGEPEAARYAFEERGLGRLERPTLSSLLSPAGKRAPI